MWRKDHKYTDLRSILNYVLGLIKNPSERQNYHKEKDWKLTSAEEETIRKFKKWTLELDKKLFIDDRWVYIDRIEEVVPEIENIIMRCLRGTPILKDFDRMRLFDYKTSEAEGITPE